MLRWFRSLVLCSALVAGCQADEPEPPAETLSRFLEAMDRSSQDASALAEAYELLDRATQRALAERAERAEQVAGRELEPHQMLVQGRFRLRFSPADHGGMRTTIDGDRATVRVVSEDGKSKADVPLVREDGRWRIELALAGGAAADSKPLVPAVSDAAAANP